MQGLLLKYNKINFVVFILFSRIACGGVLLDSSRVVFYDNQSSHSAFIFNANEYPVLTQLWVTDADHNNLPNNTISPFVIIPPILHLKSGEVKEINIYYSGSESEPSIKKESLFWLNLNEAPLIEQSTGNYMIINMTTKFKLFFRSAGLKNERLSFSCENNNGYINLINDSQFFLNYYEIDKKKYSGYLPPFQKLSLNMIFKHSINVGYIDDNGSYIKRKIKCL